MCAWEAKAVQEVPGERHLERTGLRGKWLLTVFFTGYFEGS